MTRLLLYRPLPLKKVKLTDSQEKELLQKVQKELNQFLDKMKEQLGR